MSIVLCAASHVSAQDSDNITSATEINDKVDMAGEETVASEMMDSGNSTLKASAKDEIYFDASALSDGDGSEANPYKYLRSDRITYGVTAHFKDGTYEIDSTYLISQVKLVGSGNTIINSRLTDEYDIIVAENSILDISRVYFNNVHVLNQGTLTATDTFFEGNRAFDTYFGGVIVCDSPMHKTTLVLNGCGFESVYDAYNGGAICAIDADISISNTRFSHYSTTYKGGAIYCRDSDLKLYNVWFAPNTISNDDDFTQNRYDTYTSYYGGSIYCENSNVDIDRSNFIGSVAFSFGGCIASINSTMNIRETNFNNSISLTDGGGAIYNSKGKLKIFHSQFQNNSADFGGAICNINSVLNTTYTTYSNSLAKYYGGAIYDIYGTLNLTRNWFYVSHALIGGAIYSRIPNSFNLYRNFFGDSYAKQGSGIFFDGKKENINANIFTGNEIDDGELIIPSEELRKVNGFANDYHVFAEFSATLNGKEYYMISNPLYYQLEEDPLHLYFPYSTYEVSDDKVSMTIFDSNDAAMFTSVATGNVIRNITANLRFSNEFVNPRLNFYVLEDMNIYLYNNGLPGNRYDGQREDLFKNFNLIGNYSIDLTGRASEDITESSHVDFSNPFLNIKYDNLYEAGSFYPASLVNTTFLESMSIPSGELLPYYNSRDYGLVSSVKNQKDGGNCWAFAGLATLETCLKKATGVTFDFSVENAKNLMAAYSVFGLRLETNTGGYTSMLMSYLTSWLGPIDETVEDYDEYSTISLQDNPMFHIQNIKFLPARIDSTDNELYKLAIRDYGAVSVMFNWNGYSHAVSLVGWDDDYVGMDSVGNYAHGAWIFKNSYGSDWGNEGYGYLSYEEKISEQIHPNMHAYTFIFNDINPYTEIYQYDFGGVTEFYHYTDNVYLKNTFTASSDSYLSAFSSYFDSETNFTVSVYKDEEFIFSQNGTSEAGYYTIPFSTMVQLEKGEKFSIVINNHNQGWNCVPVCSAEEITKKTFNPNVSFISLDGENWFDLYDYADSCHVACIKAFTQNTTLTDINIRINKFSTVNTKNLNIKVRFDEFDRIDSLNYCLVKIDIDGTAHYAQIRNGMATLNLNLNNGQHTLSAQYKDNLYKSNVIEFGFTVSKNQNGQSYNALQDMINEASDKSTVNLQRDYSYNEEFDDGNYGVRINKTLTINGNGHEINGLSKVTGFYIGANNVILNNIVFKDTFSQNGGAVYISARNVTLNNCTFINSKASEKGGAIYSLFDIDLNGCRFSQNNAGTGAGAHIINTKTSNIRNCVFDMNTATMHGGAISIEGAGNAVIDRTNFTNNKAAYNGGAVMSNAQHINFTDCIFIRNSANSGGALHLNGKINGIRHSEFANNTATISGGAVIANNALEIYSCEFVNNSILNHTEFLIGGYGGGAIYSFDNLNVYRSSFKSNYANASGGAVYASKYLNVYGCEFMDNTAAYDGGAVYGDVWQMTRSNVGTLKFSEASFYDTVFKNNHGTYGGALHDAHLVENCTFINNSAYNGGAIYDAKSVNGSDFINNSAETNGGAINSIKRQDSRISNSNFIANTAGFGGAIISDGNMNIISSNFTRNNAGTTAGAMYIDGTCMIDDASFAHNIAQYGGALYLGEIGNYIVKNSRFSDNSASGFGGAAFIYSSDEKSMSNSEFDHCSFTGNNAERSGGAIYVDSRISVVNSDFENNLAGIAGSAIYSRAYIDLRNSNIKSDTDVIPLYYAAHYNDDDTFYGSLHLKNNSFDTKGIGIFYADDEVKTATELYLVFNNGNLIKGESIAVAQLEDDNGNLMRVYGIGDLYLTLTDQNGVSVKVTLKYDDESGKYYLDTSAIAYGTYRLSGSLPNNHPGKYSVKMATLYITDDAGRLPAAIMSNGLTKAYGTSGNLMITLKDSYGNAIANALINVNLNGRTSQIKTNSKGEASLAINLAPKNYIATVSFSGNDNNLYSSIKTSVIVKKATPKITASKKTYKVKAKTKKYTITLKNNLGKVMKKVKVTLKISGKKYTAKTNNKGKATFKLKVKKKGNFKAAITYAGNAYYNKVTKTVRITFKK